MHCYKHSKAAGGPPGYLGSGTGLTVQGLVSLGSLVVQEIAKFRCDMWSPIKDIDGTPTDVNADAAFPNGNNNEEKSEQLLCSDAVQQETDEREIPTTQEVVMESEMEISSVPVEDDFPVDEGPLVKNKPSKRRQKKRSKKDDSDKEQRNAPWTVAEEIALCKAWVNTSEDIARGNAKKAQGFWTLVLRYLDKEMGASGIRTYDSINCKWKGMRGLLKDNKKWRELELPIIRGQGRLGKKSKSTSFNTSESAHFVQETRPLRLDKARRKRHHRIEWPLSVTDNHKQEIELKKREIALREKEFEFLQEKQCQKDELFYTTPHDHLRGKQLEIVLEIKEKIKAKYNSDD
ncbi:hypothetical protein Tco_1280636 [Tanacetum coccineum]